MHFSSGRADGQHERQLEESQSALRLFETDLSRNERKLLVRKPAINSVFRDALARCQVRDAAISRRNWRVTALHLMR